MSPAAKRQPDATRNSLLLRLRQDGPEREVAWVEFHDLYGPIIRHFAHRCGVRPQEIDDLVQDVLHAFFRAVPEFRYDPAKGRFRAYLKTCVWHKMSGMRKQRDALGIGGGSLDDLAAPAVEAIWDDVWETEKLGRALALVRERYASNTDRRRTFRAFEMCALLDRDPAEVAAELGLSHESVRAAKSRVSRALRETFESLDETVR